MLRSITVLVISIAVASSLLFSSNALAEYELPERLLGYKMILSSKARTANNQTSIGFIQFKNMTPPFVIIETKGRDLIQAKIVSEVIEDRLVGKIMLPPKVSGSDIQELRINGYSILWKVAE